MSRSDEMTFAGEVAGTASWKRFLDVTRHRNGRAGVFFPVPEQHVASHLSEREVPRAGDQRDLLRESTHTVPRRLGVAAGAKRSDRRILEQSTVGGRESLGEASHESLRISRGIAKRPEERTKQEGSVPSQPGTRLALPRHSARGPGCFERPDSADDAETPDPIRQQGAARERVGRPAGYAHHAEAIDLEMVRELDERRGANPAAGAAGGNPSGRTRAARAPPGEPELVLSRGLCGSLEVGVPWNRRTGQAEVSPYCA